MPSSKKDRREGQKGVARERRLTHHDRRRAQRILLDLEVDYKCEDTFLFAYITDLSVLGIFVRTNNPEQPGTLLNLRFTLPGDEEPLAVEGEVIWINPFRPGDFNNLNPGMGVQFVDLTREVRRRLMSLIRKIAYLEGESLPKMEVEEPEEGEEPGTEEGDDGDGGNGNGNGDGGEGDSKDAAESESAEDEPEEPAEGPRSGPRRPSN
jgi:uncharacterized protein (TIGR02266 family)